MTSRRRLWKPLSRFLLWFWHIPVYLLGLVLAVFLLYELWIYGHILWWINHNPTTSAFMEQRLDVMRQSDPQAELKQSWVSYKQVSGNLKRAIIAAEDAKFLDHIGFDFEGIQNAVEKNLKKGKIVAGGSTISQQLAKNLFLSSEKSMTRKGEEAIITLMLERTLGKRRILEIYINVVEWGDGVFGAEAAAQHYFKVSAKRLSPAQAARLAAMLPNPRYFDEHRKDRRLIRKANTIQARMPYVEIP